MADEWQLEPPSEAEEDSSWGLASSEAGGALAEALAAAAASQATPEGRGGVTQHSPKVGGSNGLEEEGEDDDAAVVDGRGGREREDEAQVVSEEEEKEEKEGGEAETEDEETSWNEEPSRLGPGLLDQKERMEQREAERTISLEEHVRREDLLEEGTLASWSYSTITGEEAVAAGAPIDDDWELDDSSVVGFFSEAASETGSLASFVFSDSSKPDFPPGASSDGRRPQRIPAQSQSLPHSLPRRLTRKEVAAKSAVRPPSHVHEAERSPAPAMRLTCNGRQPRRQPQQLQGVVLSRPRRRRVAATPRLRGSLIQS